MQQEFDTERLSLYPATSGVYLMKNADGKILYIGKAKDLRARLKSYFSETGDSRLSVRIFLPRITNIETIITKTEKEAFLLENILIKKRQPPYNLRLRDDKTYISLRIDPSKPYPRLEWARKRKKDDALYFGPYSSASSVRHTVRFLEKIFPLRSCSDSVMKNRARPCIRYQIKRCLAPCCFPVPEEEYRQLVNGVILYLRGNMEELKKKFEKRMQEHADAMRYEKAAELRDRIAAIDSTLERQNISQEKARDMDVIAHHISEGKTCVAAFQYRLGVLAGTRSFIFDLQGKTVPEIYYSFFGQFYNENSFIPGTIFVDEEPEDKSLLEEWLAELKGARVNIAIPQRGKTASILSLARENAAEHLRIKQEGERDLSLVLESLRAKLHLPETPYHIEGFDISNIQGRMAVGSLVVFQDGKPDSSRYRHFQIKTVTGSDDFAMMYEVVKRRYKRIREEGKPFPNLILIDGGKGQLGAAIKALEELGLEGMSIIGLAKSHLKEDREFPGEKFETGERIFLPNRKNPVVLKPGSPALFLIQKVRDEAHRFAITYHKKLRSKNQRLSILDEIPGIGPSRKKALLKRFGSAKAVQNANMAELLSVPGITRDIAQRILNSNH
ncbi:excinuclease ABC subunit UvrC [Candidatus Sumerlaeota bacterium]|nr:excinuclease ABC subunit UvrC [Candidatus Sumerlaeota bacterium]